MIIDFSYIYTVKLVSFVSFFLSYLLQYEHFLFILYSENKKNASLFTLKGVNNEIGDYIMKETVIKTRDKSKKRNMIIQGATKAFMERGYKNVSMDIIAEYSEVSKKTIYNHFMSKENVILTIITNYLEGKYALKNISYNSSKSIEDQLMEFANAELYLVNSPERLGLARVLTLTFIDDHNLAYRIVKQFEPNNLKFIQWLKEAIIDNKLVIKDLERASSVFYGLIEGGITYPVLFQNELNVERSQIIIEDVISTFLCRFKK